MRDKAGSLEMAVVCEGFCDTETRHDGKGNVINDSSLSSWLMVVVTLSKIVFAG
jgi:hypothetical protein